MIGDLFTAITEVVSDFISTLNSGVTSMIALFYTTGADGGELTVLGQLTVIVVGVALVYFLLRFIMGLARLRG